MVFQELENALILLFASLTDPAHDSVGIIVASQLSFRKLVDILDAVFRYRTKNVELILQLESILKGSLELEQQRNIYIHSFYDWHEISGDTVTYQRIKNRIKRGKGFSPDYEMLDTAKLGQIIDRFRILIAGIDLFFERLQQDGIITDRSSADES